MITHKPEFCCGFGQFHTAPKPYATKTKADLYEALWTAPSCDKAKAPWAIMSALHSRTFAEQVSNGVYFAVALDVDVKAPPMAELVQWWESVTGGSDAIAYTTRSATKANPKCRLIGFLSKPMAFAEWSIVSKVLNDKAQHDGIEPDRATERAAQLIYLPNRGEHYDYYFWRDENPLEPHKEWLADYEAEEQHRWRAAQDAETAKHEAQHRRIEFNASGRDSVIQQFNDANPIETILLRAGYDRQGNRFRHPNSDSGSFSASVKDGRVFSLSPNDPLHSEHAHDSFGALTILFFGGDTRRAVDAIKTAGGKE